MDDINCCDLPECSANDSSATKIEPCEYKPVPYHWFYKQDNRGKIQWKPFSFKDSENIESTYNRLMHADMTSRRSSTSVVVATDGGRYDVDMTTKLRRPVYWDGPETEVRRCSWFHKGGPDGRYVPYEEDVAARLEDEFRTASECDAWHRRVELPNGDAVVLHDENVIVLFPATTTVDSWGNMQAQAKPKIVKRGIDGFEINDGEPEAVDHLLFLVHGIGSVCDLKFRSVEEVVDDFRGILLQLIQSHYRSSWENKISNRIEVLPISWHSQLHSEATGIDQKLRSIMLESIPKFREWGHDTLLDVLFYTSPCYCQTIVSTVGNELNRVYNLFLMRNPSFKGKVSLGGHSLGSVILFDILCHQQVSETEEPHTDGEEGDVVKPLKPPPKDRKMNRRISYMMAGVGIGQPQIHYPHLEFEPTHLFALGSPIGMFVTVRGLDSLGENFRLPTCPSLFNIFHPYDPIAYRIEPLVNPLLSTVKPVLIPHHKGRKRMHLELKETVARVGAGLKQRVIDSIQSTFNSFYQLAAFNGVQQTNTPECVTEKIEEETEQPETTEDTTLSLGTLNRGRRIDYVLQEAPFEFFNGYIFALSSHLCYWESEDTILFVLKEIYGSLNIEADGQVPQQTMTIERPVSK